LLAQNDRARTRDLLEFAKGGLAQNQPPSKSLPSEPARQSTLADHVERLEIELRRSELALANAESKLKVLEEYTKPKMLKELRSIVETARADELAKRAEWELKQSNIKGLQAAINAHRLSADARGKRNARDSQVWDSLGPAISVAGSIETKLDQLTKSGKPDGLLRSEIQDLSHQLQAILDQAEAERSAAQFDELKARIHSAAK
jgi:hypothetical protein